MEPTTIMAAASVAQGVMGFKGNRAAAKQAQQVADYQAQVAENELVLTQRARRDQEVSLRRNSDRLKGTQRAATAASQITMSGSPLLALKDTYFNTEVDALRIQYAGSVEAANAASNAAMARMTGKAQAAAYNTAAFTSIIGAGSAMASFQQQQTLLGQRTAAYDAQVNFQNRLLALEEARYNKELSS
jgi:hypothetical protein